MQSPPEGSRSESNKQNLKALCDAKLTFLFKAKLICRVVQMQKEYILKQRISILN